MPRPQRQTGLQTDSTNAVGILQVCRWTKSRMYQPHSRDTCLVCHFVVWRQELQYSR